MATLTFPAGTPAGDYVVSLAVRGADGCVSKVDATIRLRDETIVPPPVGPSLRVAKAPGGIELTWTPVGASDYHVNLARLGDDLAAMAAMPPFAILAGGPATLTTGLAAQGAGTAFIQVYSTSDCGRVVP